jgi:hypothetical protein
MEGKDWVAVAGILGTLGGTFLGGFLQNHFAIERERAKTVETRQGEAFTSLLNAMDKGRVAAEREREGKKEEAARLEEAFQLEAGAAFRRIGIYGDKEVAEAIAAWSRQGRKLGQCPTWWRADLKVWETMRDRTRGANQRVERDDLIQLTLFCDPSTVK